MGATRVAVGMSGGVDSSTAAAILVRSGLEVVGVTMRTWNREGLAGAATTAHGCYGPSEVEDIADARRVADALGIPLVEVNLAEEYGRTVLDYVRAEYAAGRTPNPCVRCNPRMKFGLLWDKMQELGLAAEIEHVTDMKRIAQYRVMMTPALVIDGQVKSSGRIPSPEEIKNWLGEAGK